MADYLQQVAYIFEASGDRNPLHRQIEILLQLREIRNEIKIKVAHNQPTNYVSRSRETYYTENTKSKETKKNETKSLFTKSEKQNN